ncbi:MAG: hypothetical protein K2M87_00310 [Muribaculaceae bacterium]|nr:hypothetical protein [Muribaculaceae bacterium]
MSENINNQGSQIVADFGEKVRKDLFDFLRSKDAIDAKMPQCPDVEECANGIIKSYIPDGIREFQQYPIVSLGWMMLIGMAMAWYWDNDWEKAVAEGNYYEKIRDIAGYDNLDDSVVKTILGYEGEKAEKVSDSVAECASRVYTMLTHSHIEPGTPEAFGCYVAALHQMYLMGMAVELHALGYHMTAFDPSQN